MYIDSQYIFLEIGENAPFTIKLPLLGEKQKKKIFLQQKKIFLTYTVNHYDEVCFVLLFMGKVFAQSFHIVTYKIDHFLLSNDVDQNTIINQIGEFSL